MTLWDHACCVGHGLHARCDALWHLLRGHRLHWRDSVDLWVGVTGDIWCERCPDTSDGQSDLIIWIRGWAWMLRVAQWICGLQGHRELKHPQRWNKQEPIEDKNNMVDVEGEWYCYRCFADVEKPEAAPEPT